ncbi:MAG TPA: class I SAM-dependent methyltransferase [Gemmatimonadaceae bacterium]|nr:class I SAM-dependent methyltransferase [Gemmatimonadaceae bacterium]
MNDTSYEFTPCPICGAVAATEVAGAEDIRAEIEQLWAFQGQRLDGETPVYRLMDRVVFSQRPALRLVACDACAHVYRNPWERRETLERAYQGAKASSTSFEQLFRTQRPAFAAQARRLVATAGASGRGLEVGSYVGAFLAAMRHSGWSFEGVDISREAVAFASDHGLNVTLGGIDDVHPARPYDAVVVYNTFEQLYDSAAVLGSARRVLRAGGLLTLRVPNGTFYRHWRARLGGPVSPLAVRVLAHNNLLTFPYRQAFSQRSLAMLLDRAGFEPMRVVGDTLVPIADCWTTRLGAAEERAVKWLERLVQRGWRAPWVEVYATRRPDAARDRALATAP